MLLLAAGVVVLSLTAALIVARTSQRSADRRADGLQAQLDQLLQRVLRVEAVLYGLQAVPAEVKRVAVEPSSGLRDGQTIEVAFHGFAAGERVTLAQCLPSAVEDGLASCGTATTVVADLLGGGRTTLPVVRVLRSDGASADCAVVTCVVAVGTSVDRFGYAGIDLVAG